MIVALDASGAGDCRVEISYDPAKRTTTLAERGLVSTKRCPFLAAR